LLSKRPIEVYVYPGIQPWAVTFEEKELSFNGFQFLKIFQEYDKNPYYDQDYENIVTAFFGLYENKNIDKEEATKILTKFFNDKKLPVSIKIETESQAFKLGLIR
jgi:hypothetical protein